MNYARRQQYRRLSHAGKAGLGGVIAALLGLVTASAGAAPLAGPLLLAAVGLGLYARHWLSLAGRSRVGARSEDEVQRALVPLRRRAGGVGTPCPGKAGETSTRWRSPPVGWRFAIETKTRTYDVHRLARVHEQAVWLSRRRRRWCRHGVLAVLCLVRVRGVQRVEDDVLVVSIDRLMPVVRSAAGAVLPPLRSGR